MEIHTEIEINASADAVYKVLTDFASYGSWNPVITKIEGSPSVGGSVSFSLKAAPMIELPIPSCEVLVASGRELRWRGPSIPVLDLVLTGEHYFIIQEAGEKKVRFVHGENFTGFAAKALEPLLQQRITESYSSMNRALKDRCEGRI